MLWTLFCPVYWTHVHYYSDVLVRVQDHSSLNSQDQEQSGRPERFRSSCQYSIITTLSSFDTISPHQFPSFFFFFFENSVFKTLVWVNLSQIEYWEYWSFPPKIFRNLNPHQCTLTQYSYKNKGSKQKTFKPQHSGKHFSWSMGRHAYSRMSKYLLSPAMKVEAVDISVYFHFIWHPVILNIDTLNIWIGKEEGKILRGDFLNYICLDSKCLVT